MHFIFNWKDCCGFYHIWFCWLPKLDSAICSRISEKAGWKYLIFYTQLHTASQQPHIPHCARTDVSINTYNLQRTFYTQFFFTQIILGSFQWNSASNLVWWSSELDLEIRKSSWPWPSWSRNVECRVCGLPEHCTRWNRSCKANVGCFSYLQESTVKFLNKTTFATVIKWF